jgi:hypothetical protein
MVLYEVIHKSGIILKLDFEKAYEKKLGVGQLLVAPPPRFSWSRLGDVVPMVSDLVSSPRVLGKRVLILVNQIFLLMVKLLSAPSDLEELVSAT